MNYIDFVQEFNNIKPNINEILSLDPFLTEAITEELFKDFDLQFTSLSIGDNPVIDLILNTNIHSLYYCKILFVNDFFVNNSMFKIGYVMEVSDLYFNSNTKDIFIVPIEGYQMNENKCSITQEEFLSYLLKYLEVHFNTIFRKGKTQKFLNIEVNLFQLKMNPLFKILLSEMEI